ncbi:MAG: preprotein translocase subunit SecG [Acidobacteriota bacterium]|nr:MAG: preprotein translocase subunit SecG [Acidobacteriota bacterium]
MYAAVLVIHVIVCVFLILVVLLQTGKGGDIAAAFGGSGSQAVFGPRGASNVLSKATTWSAVIFMVTSLALVFLSQGGRQSVLDAAPQAGGPAVEEPATPGAETDAAPSGAQPGPSPEPAVGAAEDAAGDEAAAGSEGSPSDASGSSGGS